LAAVQYERQQGRQFMKALTLNGYEGLPSLRLAEVAAPKPGPNDVLVRVRAASVNPVDGKISTGYAGTSRPMPHVLGRDCAGIVIEVGGAVTAFKRGDEVYGVADAARWGTHAEFVAMPAATTAMKPAGLSDVEAASLPISGLSAYAGLVTVGKLTRGQSVLIHAGAGGVGSFAVQLAKHLGATVAATAGTANLEFVRSLGADRVIDYAKTDFTQAIKNCDLVFDLIGGEVRYRSFAVVKPGGAIVHISVPPMTQPPPRGDVEVRPAPVKYDTALLDRITELVQTKAVRPTVTKAYRFGEALKAYEHVMTGHARGKVVLDMGNGG
jgi:NADPH:quinone reductase-like Zn-dependent oxidoreductase